MKEGEERDIEKQRVVARKEESPCFPGKNEKKLHDGEKLRRIFDFGPLPHTELKLILKLGWVNSVTARDFALNSLNRLPYGDILFPSLAPSPGLRPRPLLYSFHPNGEIAPKQSGSLPLLSIHPKREAI